jgi:hypothetical protein
VTGSAASLAEVIVSEIAVAAGFDETGWYRSKEYRRPNATAAQRQLNDSSFASEANERVVV